MDRNDLVILGICGADQHCVINGISKNEALNVWKNADLRKKWIIIKYNNSS